MCRLDTLSRLDMPQCLVTTYVEPACSEKTHAEWNQTPPSYSIRFRIHVMPIQQYSRSTVYLPPPSQLLSKKTLQLVGTSST